MCRCEDDLHVVTTPDTPTTEDDSCPEGYSWSTCAYSCNQVSTFIAISKTCVINHGSFVLFLQLCLAYGSELKRRGYCLTSEGCVPGCIENQDTDRQQTSSVTEVAFLVESGEMSAPVSRQAIAIVAHHMEKSSHQGASTSRKTVAKCASAWITNTYAIIHDANIRGQHLPSKEGEIFRIRTTPKPRPPGPTTSPSSCSAWSDWINEYANTAGGDYETKTVKQLNPMGFCLNEKIVDIDCCDVKNNRPWTETRDKKYGLLTRQRSSLLSYPSR